MINETDHHLQIVYLNPAAGDDGEENLHDVAPGAKVIAAASVDCTAHPVVARTDDGNEIARHEQPLCVGDTWVIERP